MRRWHKEEGKPLLSSCWVALQVCAPFPDTQWPSPWPGSPHPRERPADEPGTTFQYPQGQALAEMPEHGHQQAPRRSSRPTASVTSASAPASPPDPTCTQWPCQAPARQSCSQAGPGHSKTQSSSEASAC